MSPPTPLHISLLLWIGSTEIFLMEFTSERGHPIEHHYKRVSQSPIHRLKTYMELVRHIERHRFCALSGPGMDKNHFLTWLFGHGDPLVKRIVSTDESLSGSRESLIDLRTDLIRRLG